MLFTFNKKLHVDFQICSKILGVVALAVRGLFKKKLTCLMNIKVVRLKIVTLYKEKTRFSHYREIFNFFGPSYEIFEI